MKKQLLYIILFAIILSGLVSCVSSQSKAGSLLEMVLVSGGNFDMGSIDGKSTEKPVHNVKLESFFMSKFEITQSQWQQVMGEMPSLNSGTGENYPVYNISWNDALDFCNSLSQMEGLTPCYSGKGSAIKWNTKANGYRLPTEAEWEYAARGGNKSRGFLYAGSDDADQAGWHAENGQGNNHEVGLKIPNELGIYDLSGNVWEWCWDKYGAKYYESSPDANPQGPASGVYHVLRGGSRGINASGLSVFNRYMGTHRSDDSTGFRVVRNQ